MGFYDCRCMITGVSLKGAEAVLVLLQQHEPGRQYFPIALAIRGMYNRLGAIDDVRRGANATRLLNFFFDKLRTGEFVVDEAYLRAAGAYPITAVEHLLSGFERSINDNPDASALRGQRVVFALISAAIWDSLVQDYPCGDTDPATIFRQLFDGVPIAAELYRADLESVSDPLRELSAVSRLLADRQIAWRPADDVGQDYADDMQQYLATARNSFRDSPVVLRGLDSYEREIGDLLTDD